MLHMKIIAVSPQIHTKLINAVCGQNVECLTVTHVVLPHHIALFQTIFQNNFEIRGY